MTTQLKVTAKVLQQVLDLSESYSQKLLTKIRRAHKKETQHIITLDDVAKYKGVNKDLLIEKLK